MPAGVAMKPTQKELAAAGRFHRDVDAFYRSEGLAIRHGAGHQLTPKGVLAFACMRLVEGVVAGRQPRSIQNEIWPMHQAGCAAHDGPPWLSGMVLTAKGRALASLARGIAPSRPATKRVVERRAA
jgi:hypothetical protein